MFKKLLPVLILLILPVTALAALININTASMSELENITGVGPVIAQRIVDYRNANGSFKTIEEIKNVKGIGDATYEKMKGEITVGDSSAVIVEESNDKTSTESTDDASSNNDTVSNSYISTGQISAHASQTSLSGEEESLTWKITAGRPRRVLIDAPLVLQAKTVAGEPSGTLSYYWSFGDGTSFNGRDAVHTYRFPGTYQVVLDGRSGDETAVARTIVQVESPKLTIEWLPGGYAAKIKNMNTEEVNLGGFRIASGSTTFLIIPNDTIVAGNNAITIPLPGQTLVNQLSLGDLALYSPGGLLAAVKPIIEPVKTVAAVPAIVKPSSTVVNNLPVGDTATVTVIELGSPKTSWWHKLLNWFKT